MTDSGRTEIVAAHGNGHLRVAIFGLGEAGSEFARDLVREGLEVHAYDPGDRDTPAGVKRHAHCDGAVTAVDLVLALTPSHDAEVALRQALEKIPGTAVYADLSTAPATLKRRLGAIASDAGLLFADVSLLAPVPGRGIRTEQLVSGVGARRYVELMTPLGSPVSSVGGQPGDAASRKLLRSVVTKGIAALLIEAVRAGQAAGLDDWLWPHLVDTMAGMDEATMRRLVNGTGVHAHRRCHEMEAASDMLVELGVEPIMTRGTITSLQQAEGIGVPTLSTLATTDLCRPLGPS